MPVLCSVMSAAVYGTFIKLDQSVSGSVVSPHTVPYSLMSSATAHSSVFRLQQQLALFLCLSHSYAVVTCDKIISERIIAAHEYFLLRVQCR